MAILQSLLSYLTAHPQPLRNHTASLYLAQRAPLFLSSADAARDTQEAWLVYEQLLLSCLHVKDDQSARLCLQRLGDRFGPNTARVRALAGLFDEATTPSRQALEGVLRRYEKLLKEDPTNLPIEKRRVALLRSLGRTEDAITALTRILGHSPTDAEAWSELADLYRVQGLYKQSIFCLEEVLLIHPNAYSIHARIGETLYVGAPNSDLEILAESARYYCRSVELCEWYLRGWYGLKLVTDAILATRLAGKSVEGNGRSEIEAAAQLNSKAGTRLQEIIRRASQGESGWQGFDAGELQAASELMVNS